MLCFIGKELRRCCLGCCCLLTDAQIIIELRPISYYNFYFCTYQKGAEHVKGDEVNYCKSAATRHLLPRVVIGLWVTQFPWHTGQHDLLPRLSSGTPGGTYRQDRHKWITQLSNPEKLKMHCLILLMTPWTQNPTHLKRRSTAWGKVWKLLFLLMCVPSTMATFPNTWRRNIVNMNLTATLPTRVTQRKNIFCHI